MYNLMYEIFRKTGSIEAFLYIKNYQELTKEKE